MAIDDVNEENFFEKIIEMFEEWIEEWIKDDSIPEGWDVDIDAKGRQLILRINPKKNKSNKQPVLHKH